MEQKMKSEKSVTSLIQENNGLRALIIRMKYKLINREAVINLYKIRIERIIKELTYTQKHPYGKLGNTTRGR